MRILILGGTRFIGPVIIKHLLSQGWECTTFSRSGKNTFSNVSTILGDRNNPQDIKKIDPAKYDVIIDTCAYNLLNLQNIANIINNTNHYIFISTAAVYKTTTETTALKENSPRGRNEYFEDYGTNKIACEDFLLDESLKSRITILRPTYILGPNNPYYREEYFFDGIQKDKSIKIPRESKVNASFVDVNDVAEIILRTIKTAPITENPKIYNVANDIPISYKTLAELCLQTTNKTASIVEQENPLKFPFPSISLSIDVSKVKSELNVELTPTLQTLRRAWAAYIEKA